MNTDDIIALSLRAETLKHLRRTGWTIAGLGSSNEETVAAHAWGACLISLLIAEKIRSDGNDVDLRKVLTMAILHDLPEAIVSDIPLTAVQFGGDSMRSSKEKTEAAAARHMLRPLGEVGTFLADLWEEFVACKTLEARIVNAADKVDMLTHAVSLEQAGCQPALLNEFFHNSQHEEAGSSLDVFEELYSKLLGLHRSNKGKAPHSS
ncbi:MAG: hypothetical protein C4K49_03595 [Candidatus Thorarchaeota archaeon]|nr:MAG: hypothetical protein C4K49_03595 [Candidatus Thorarchaeota archaeon]